MCGLFFRAKIKGVGVPRFDIAGNTVLLIYAQTVIWIGHYFSPLLPIVFAMILFITFYVKKVRGQMDTFSNLISIYACFSFLYI